MYLLDIVLTQTLFNLLLLVGVLNPFDN